MNAPATINVALPASVARVAEDLAQDEGVSLDAWIATLVAEKVDAVTFFRQRAQGASRGALLELLDEVPDVPPLPGDELPEDYEPPR